VVYLENDIKKLGTMEAKLKRIRFRKDGKLDFETDDGVFSGCSLHIDKDEKQEKKLWQKE